MKFSYLDKSLANLKKQKALRHARVLEVNQYKASDQQKSLYNFSSNDYLGLAGDSQLQMEFFQQSGIKKSNWMSASSSRPLTGTSASHAELEALLAKSYGKNNALLFNSGYHANTGILPAITSDQDLVLADKLVHASLIDGLRLGDAKFKRFAHNDLNHLNKLLNNYRNQYRNVWIVTESVFSMDGDLAPLEEIISLKNEYQSALYLDEAHAVGVFGKTGLGLAEQLNVIQDIDILVGTFGKSLAGCGGYAVAESTLIETLINFSRSWLFSTALPPLNIDWNLFVWQQLQGFDKQRKRLTELEQLLKEGLSGIERQFLGSSHIVPTLEAGNNKVVALASKLESHGVLAMPIRSPTVAKGAERIRFSLTANLPESAIKNCIEGLQ
ncbi:MAG: 8-amino-7-oxononanoate synthase [Acidiferrobacterales bacterium]|nr:8-amino-7-oxononanoate synthase [Acidiferrobacterales bacterium]